MPLSSARSSSIRRAGSIPRHLPVPGRVVESRNFARYGSCRDLRHGPYFGGCMVYSDLRIGAAGDRIHADDRLYSGDRGSGADGGNHVEEGVSVALSGAWNFPAAHYDELCRAGRGDSDDLQGVQPVAEHRLFRGDGHRLRIGAGAVRRYSRAARTGGCPQGRAGGFPWR